MNYLGFNKLTWVVLSTLLYGWDSNSLLQAVELKITPDSPLEFYSARLVKGIFQGEKRRFLLTELPDYHPLKSRLPNNPLLPLLYTTLTHAAESWKVSKKQNKITVSLKKVKPEILIELLDTYHQAGKNNSFFTNLKAMTKTGPKEVTFYFYNAHYLNLRTLLTQFYLFDPAEANRKNITPTGEYIITHRDKNQIIVQSKGDRKKNPITFIRLNTRKQLFSMIQKGTLQKGFLTSDEVLKLEPERRLQYSFRELPLTRTPAISMILWNPKRMPMARFKEVRKALTLLIDRQEINQQIFANSLEPTTSFFGNKSIYQGSNASLRYNPKSALSLIQKVGIPINYKTAQIPDLKFTLTLLKHPTLEKIAKSLERKYGQNGIKMQIKTLLLDEYRKALKEKKYQAIILSLALSNEFNPVLTYSKYLPLLKWKDSNYSFLDKHLRPLKSYYQNPDRLERGQHPFFVIPRFFKAPFSLPAGMIQDLNSIDKDKRVAAMRKYDKYLFNTYFASLLFEPTVEYQVQRMKKNY